MVLPRSIDEIWAKSAATGASRGETLDEHTHNVVQRLVELRRRAPQLSSMPGNERLWQRLFWSCVLHDVGKAAQGFQDNLRDQAQRWGHRHEIASLAFLPWVIEPASVDYTWIAATIASHHRDADRIEQRYPWREPEGMALDTLLGGFDGPTLEAIAEWLATAPKRWIAEFGLDEAGISLPARLSPITMAATFSGESGPEAVVQGLKSYARLRHQLERGSPELAQFGILHRGTMLLADRLGSAHARPLETLKLPEPAALLPHSPRDHQRCAGAVRGSLVLVAPTGSGKTEASLLWAKRQQAEDPSHRTLVYLLPYQASLNAMHQRLKAVLHTEVGLLHGKSTLALFRELLDEGYNSRDATRTARRARDLATLQRPSVQVATPYQLLRAAYRLRGYEMIWTGLHGALIVADELHAYEPSRTGLILGLLRRLIRDWNVQVCAITATMPTWLRTLAREAIGARKRVASDKDFAQFRRHELHLVPGEIEDVAVLDEIVRRVEAGAAVLVAANTVRRAQAVWTVLRERLGHERTRLLHSRFTARDRLSHEHGLEELCGLGIAERHPVAVVATQTIEVSLNLDFDMIFSEPAPLEALAQRFGRVNRTGRLSLAPVYVLTEPEGGQGVYDDELVSRTLAILSSVDGEALDESQLSVLLDRGYGEELAAHFTAEVRRNQEIFERFCLDDLKPFESDERLEEQFDRLFDGVEVLPASLEQEYGAQVLESPLEAQSLLVPIGYQRQFLGLRRANRVRRGPKGVWVADLPYDRMLGLELLYTPLEQ